MADAKKISKTKKVGGQKKISARRPSSTRKKPRVMATWKYITISTLITIGALALAYRPILRPAFNRFTTCNGHKIYGACIPKGYSVYGIDVSHHQGEIDWKRLKRGTPNEPPISFVYIKATEGSDHNDTRFEKNWDNAKNNNFLCGAYHYFSTTSSGKAQAELFISKVNLEPGDLPPMVDIEDEPDNATEYKEELKNFICLLENHYKVKPLIYTYRKFHDKYIDDVFFNDYPLWIAQYNVTKPGITNEWTMWQCTKNGKLPGIGHKVDINIFNGSIEELNSLVIK